MFRVSHYMKRIKHLEDRKNNSHSPSLSQAKKSPQPPVSFSQSKGPVVIWNLIRRCNLACKHCYTNSYDKDFPNELSLEEIYNTLEDLKNFQVPVVIFSGGEPLLHPHIWKIIQKAKEMGFYVGLSTNGTLFNNENIQIMKKLDLNYVGISIDGMEETHDRFRSKKGAFQQSLHAVDLCLKENIKVGLRYCLTLETQEDFEPLLELIQKKKIPKFYMSHLNYSGRGNKNKSMDVYYNMTRNKLLKLFDFAWNQIVSSEATEVVTGNNDADAIYFLFWLRERFPQYEESVLKWLKSWGGNATGVHIANIDNQGFVHPDSFWWDYNLGNIRTRKFSEIWSDTSDPLMYGFKQSPRKIKGRCSLCKYFSICNGNTRTRAFQLTGDAFEEDPACYLTNEEIGVSSQQPRIFENTPPPKNWPKKQKEVHFE